MGKKKLIVVSADAMVGEDVGYLKTLPNYRRYLAGGSEVKCIRTIYPTITYPAHTSIATGTYPNKHGITSNLELHVGERQLPWNWFHSAVKVPDLFTAAKKAGLTTAAVFWPVTGNHPDIDYLIDEYWTQSADDTVLEAFARSGSSPQMLEIVKKNLPTIVERKHPMCDDFLIACGCDIIRRFQPDLIMLHPAQIDDYRHKFGIFNDKVTKGVQETDGYIGQLMQAAEDAGVLKDTNFVLISDHGQMDIKRIMNPNVILADKGLIQIGPDGKISDWKAYSLSGGLSALVYLKDPRNRAVYDKTYEVLSYMRDEGIYGISEVFTEAQSNTLHGLGGDFSFVLETDGFSAFGDAWTRPIVTNFDFSDYRYGRATHGYLPEKGPQPILLAKGPDFAENVVVDYRHITDEGPTFAKLLGTSLPDADGTPIDAILRGGSL